jgi:hypothetical protein
MDTLLTESMGFWNCGIALRRDAQLLILGYHDRGMAKADPSRKPRVESPGFDER